MGKGRIPKEITSCLLGSFLALRISWLLASMVSAVGFLGGTLQASNVRSKPLIMKLRDILNLLFQEFFNQLMGNSMELGRHALMTLGVPGNHRGSCSLLVLIGGCRPEMLGISKGHENRLSVFHHARLLRCPCGIQFVREAEMLSQIVYYSVMPHSFLLQRQGGGSDVGPLSLQL